MEGDKDKQVVAGPAEPAQVVVTLAVQPVYEPSVHIVWSLNNRRLKLKNGCSLCISIEKIDDNFIVYNEIYRVSGIGKIVEEAKDELIDFFVHDYFYYKRLQENQLSEKVRELLKKYEIIIERI